ncbi:MAG: type III-B CRISPR module RAMP protein Cmr6 [Campylobacterota bacterium]|nr:type III-B CRISPR module RAMP protein Cmr6 [Campylobacterota bacterium]
MGLVNLGYTFYRVNEYSDDVDYGRNIIEKCKSVRVNSAEYFDLEGTYKIVFKTTYPSLAIGLGYTHNKMVDSDFKLGFLFDYTTGLPYIPGSSLKGIIRSMFPLDKKDKERLGFINDTLGKNLSFDEMYELERSIFGKSTKDSSSFDDVVSKDIFHDGYFGTGVGGFLSSDNITPHKDEITSPDPLKLLKITPDTKVVLQFELKENTLIGKKERLRLYTKILEWTGLGAKTNVGYGVVDNVKYEYTDIESKESVEELFDEIEKKRLEKEDAAIINSLPEHERIAKETVNSTKKMIEVLRKEKCSQEARMPLAKMIKKILMEHDSTWKNAKKGALKNKEFIESVLEK